MTKTIAGLTILKALSLTPVMARIGDNITALAKVKKL